MNMSFSNKSLTVVEKFRAPAALYRPSNLRGHGWTVSAESGMGGEVIIQDQQDAKSAADNPKTIAVVRYQLHHGRDTMNCRILKGLPIYRKNEKTVLFKSASTNSGGIRVKTVFQLVFETTNATDEFLMWWYEKNGSNKNRYSNNNIETTPIKRKAMKRKATKRKKMDSTNYGSAYPQMKNSHEEASTPKKKRSLKLLRESTNQPTQNGANKENVNVDFEPAAQSQNIWGAFESEFGIYE